MGPLARSVFAFDANGAMALPPAIAAPGETMVATLHAEGAQIYECLSLNRSSNTLRNSCLISRRRPRDESHH
jgi:hypothetical protein